jgi:chemotaxis signal transduction protein
MSTYPTQSSALLHDAYNQNLEQLSDEEFWSYARELAYAQPSPPIPNEEFLECELERGRCILPLAMLREVAPLPVSFTILPGSPSWMSGIASWRGTILAVADLAAYFSQGRAHTRTNALLLVAQHENIFFGLSTKVISSITSLHLHQIKPLEPTHTNNIAHMTGVVGLYEDAFILDLQTILSDMMQRIKVTTAYE